MGTYNILCSGRGKSIGNSTCACQNGFYGENCSISIANVLPTIFTLYTVYIILFSSILLIVGSSAIFTYSRGRNNIVSKISLGRNMTIVLLVSCFICLIELLHFSIDPLGMKYIIPYAPYRVLLFGPRFPAYATLLATMLIHWSSLYNDCIDRIRQNEMIKRINPTYSFNVSLEEVITNVDLVNRLVIFLLSTVAIVWIYQFARDILTVTFVVDTSHPFVQPVWLSLFCLIYTVYFFGFLYYGSLLPKILPVSLRRKLEVHSIKIKIACGFYLLAWIAVTIIFSIKRPGPYYYLAGDFVARTTGFILISVVLSSFVRLYRSFPFFIAIERYKSNNSGSDIERNRTVDSESDVVEIPIEPFEV